MPWFQGFQEWISAELKQFTIKELNKAPKYKLMFHVWRRKTWICKLNSVHSAEQRVQKIQEKWEILDLAPEYLELSSFQMLPFQVQSLRESRNIENIKYFHSHFVPYWNYDFTFILFSFRLTLKLTSLISKNFAQTL